MADNQDISNSMKNGMDAGKNRVLGFALKIMEDSKLFDRNTIDNMVKAVEDDLNVEIEQIDDVGAVMYLSELGDSIANHSNNKGRGLEYIEKIKGQNRGAQIAVETIKSEIRAWGKEKQKDVSKLITDIDIAYLSSGSN